MINFQIGDEVTAMRGFCSGQSGTITKITTNTDPKPIHISSREDDWVTAQWHRGGLACMPANHWARSAQLPLDLESGSGDE